MKSTHIAVLTDIHGNSIALEAVLSGIQAQGGVEAYWVLGDLVALGHDPVGVLELLSALPEVRYVRGNTDRYVFSGERPGPPLSKIQPDLDRLARHIQFESSFSWTAGALAGSGWLPWLADLPLQFRAELPDGTRLLAVHASPGTDDGNGIHAHTTDNELRGLLADAEADLILVGHTHSPFDRRIDEYRVVNPGSMSNQYPPDLRAGYSLIVCNPDGYSLELHRVDYDREAVVKAVKSLKQPLADYIARFMRGENKPGWMQPKKAG